jgi:hypothetical protein
MDKNATSQDFDVVLSLFTVNGSRRCKGKICQWCYLIHPVAGIFEHSLDR